MKANELGGAVVNTVVTFACGCTFVMACAFNTLPSAGVKSPTVPGAIPATTVSGVFVHVVSTTAPIRKRLAVAVFAMLTPVQV